jgi:hypothetical protein
MTSTTDWQSFAALIAVAATLTLFIARAVRAKGKTSCGGGCNCEVKPKTKRAD